MQKTERAGRKWIRLFMMLGSLWLLFHGSAVLAKAAEAEVKWKVVTQEINEEQQYVYDGDKPDVTINGVFPDQTGNQWRLQGSRMLFLLIQKRYYLKRQWEF